MGPVLVIDCGSSGMRGILFSSRGEILRSERREYFMDIRGDAATQDAAVYRDSLISVCSAVSEVIRREKLELSAISFTSQRSSVLPVDKEGRPLSPILTWYDKRSMYLCQEINDRCKDEILHLSGSPAMPVLSAPKMLWLKRHEPELYRDAYKLIGIHDYLLFLCTGAFVTDVTLASRSGLMDIRSLHWSERLAEIYGIDTAKLCRLMPQACTAGTLTEAFAALTNLPHGTPVISAGGDQQCSVLGQGLFEAGCLGINCGTGAYITAVCAEPVIPKDDRIQLTAAVNPGLWTVESSIPAAGSVFDWFNKTFYDTSTQQYPQEQINADIAASPAGANGLSMNTDLINGGSFSGITLSHTRADFARAMAEGLAAALAGCLNIVRCETGPVKNIRATGGLTKSAAFDQILADMIDMPLENSVIKETTALGAFLAAETALGRYPSVSDAYLDLCSPSEGTVYDPDPERAALYRKRLENNM